MTRRKGELSANKIGRERPELVRAALGDQIMGNNHHILHEFCRGLSLCPRGARGAAGQPHMPRFLFRRCVARQAVLRKFGGERFDPKDRGRGRTWFIRS